MAFYFLFFAPRAFSSIYSYSRHRRKCSALRSVLSVYGNFYALGQSLVDKIAIQSGCGEKFTFDLDGEDHLREMVAGGRGGFLVSAHVGNWDVAGGLLKRINARVHVVMLDAEHRRIKELLGDVLKESKVDIIPIKEDMSHIVRIREALDANDLICMHGDRFLEGAKTMIVPFLGKDARFPQGPFLLPSRFGVPVTFVFAMKEGARHYHFYATPPIIPEPITNPKNREVAVRGLLEKYTEHLERILGKYPLQWFNYYDFWR